jgi:hypothetical protein
LYSVEVDNPKVEPVISPPGLASVCVVEDIEELASQLKLGLPKQRGVIG